MHDGGRKRHPSRDVDDSDLRNTVRFIEWNEPKIRQFLSFVYRTSMLWDHSAASYPITTMLNQMEAAASSTFELGDFGGVIVFFPIIVEDNAVVQFYIWDPMYMRRPDLMKATLRYAFKTWKLRRITAVDPGPNRLACRFVEKLGFKLEGVIRRGVVYNKGVGDTHMYGLLPEEL